jgi:hypothetical protein
MPTYTIVLNATMLSYPTKPTFPPEYGSATVSYRALQEFVDAVNNYSTTLSGTESERRVGLETALDSYLSGLSSYTGPTEVVCNNSEPIGDEWQATLGVYVHPAEDVGSNTPLIVIAQDGSGTWWQAHVEATSTPVPRSRRPVIHGKTKAASSRGQGVRVRRGVVHLGKKT